MTAYSRKGENVDVSQHLTPTLPVGSRAMDFPLVVAGGKGPIREDT